MKGKLSKIILLVFVLLGTGTSAFYMLQCKNAIDALPVLPPLPKGAEELAAAKEAGATKAEAPAPEHGGGGHESGGHGAPEKKEGGHGEGGHGEAKAEGHGEGGHGEAKAEGHGEGGHGEGGHGEAKAEGHGEGGHGEAHAEGGHGEGGHGGAAPRAPASHGLPLFTIDELYVNVASTGTAHTLGLKLELEMFEEKNRSLLDSRQAAIRSQIIEAARLQDYFSINSLSGKLYFKEILVGRLNEYFRQPVIKDIHFSLFYLQ